ncbi:MAG: hypothetical protein CL908_26820 [Deltaproteobacteria bacterium]|jgi:hypothetical protein|nr:hypothetical protein [Deltaproteobacteria bacterium]
MSGKRTTGLLLLVAGILLASPVSQAAGGDALDEVMRDAAIMQVLDRYMEALNALDMEAHVATYHFPHYRHASGEIVVWQNAQEAMPILASPADQRRERLRAILEPEWHRSEWTRRDIVQADDRKVHVVTRFERLREDGSLIKAFDSLYVMTFEGNRWGIKGRSSFAP